MCLGQDIPLVGRLLPPAPPPRSGLGSAWGFTAFRGQQVSPGAHLPSLAVMVWVCNVPQKRMCEAIQEV